MPVLVMMVLDLAPKSNNKLSGTVSNEKASAHQRNHQQNEKATY